MYRLEDRWPIDILLFRSVKGCFVFFIVSCWFIVSLTPHITGWKCVSHKIFILNPLCERYNINTVHLAEQPLLEPGPWVGHHGGQDPGRRVQVSPRQCPACLWNRFSRLCKTGMLFFFYKTASCLDFYWVFPLLLKLMKEKTKHDYHKYL